MLPSRLFLTGFMGSGKTTVGALLAERLGYRFADLDARVEDVAGRSPVALFTERGEALFRAIETGVLTQSLDEEQIVIATGGGALVSEGTMRLAQEAGSIIYLRVPVPVLVRRLRHHSTERPMLHDENGAVLPEAALTERIESLLARRVPFYERADWVVDADERTPEEVADKVLELVRSEMPA